MNFVQEFTEQQLSKNISSGIIEQLQNCHSAVEQLISTLEALRSCPKIHMINGKINRYSAYLATKQELLDLLQNNHYLSLIDWLIDNKISSPLAVEIIKKQQHFVCEQLQRIIRQVFLSQQSLEEFLQENQLVGNCVILLKEIMQELNFGRSPSRQKIKSIDSMQAVIQEKINGIQNKIIKFSSQIDKIVYQFDEFQQVISQQFRHFLTKDIAKSSKIIEKQKSSLMPERDNKTQEENFYQQSFSNRNQAFKTRYSVNKQPSALRNNFVQTRSSINKNPSKVQEINLGLQSRININSQLKRESRQGLQKSSNSSFLQSLPSNPYR